MRHGGTATKVTTSRAVMPKRIELRRRERKKAAMTPAAVSSRVRTSLWEVGVVSPLHRAKSAPAGV